MEAVATSSGLERPFKRRRNSSSDDETASKRPRYFYILAAETTDEGTSEAETIYSLQGHTTDLAKDTSDTSSSCDDRAVVEFEVVSLSDSQVYPLPMQDSSSTPLDIVAFDPLPIKDSESESCDGSSGTTEANDCRRRLFLFSNCVRCGIKNPLPFFRYCHKCYKVRKNFFPPRPRGHKNPNSLSKRKKSLRQESGDVKLSASSGLSMELSINLSEKVSEEGRTPGEGCEEEDSSSQAKELCDTCLVRPKNGAYVHNNIVHVYSCYKCSIKIVKEIGRCPVCNLRVNRVCRVIKV